MTYRNILTEVELHILFFIYFIYNEIRTQGTHTNNEIKTTNIHVCK